MKEIPVLDEIELRVQMRKMYRDIGFKGSFQVLYELLRSAEILGEIIEKERKLEI